MSALSRFIHYWLTNFGQLCRFGLVGIATFGVNFLAFSVFFGLLHLDYRVAVSLAYLLTVCCHFLLNKRFTFGATEQKLRDNAPRYVLMLGLNYVITIVAAWLTVEVVGASPYFGVVASTAGTALSSFFVMKYFVFRDSAAAPRAASVTRRRRVGEEAPFV
jgi:putative flippase GtrA